MPESCRSMDPRYRRSTQQRNTIRLHTMASFPEDFTSTWKVNADGRWLGEWRLNVNEAGHAKGVFVSGRIPQFL